jgi:hypothetical protein
MEAWRIEMETEIDRINKDLPTVPPEEKAVAIAIQSWIHSAYRMLEGYECQHEVLLETTTTDRLD